MSKVKLKDHLYRELVDDLVTTCATYRNTQQLRAQISGTVSRYVEPEGKGNTSNFKISTKVSIVKVLKDSEEFERACNLGYAVNLWKCEPEEMWLISEESPEKLQERVVEDKFYIVRKATWDDRK